MKLLLTGDSIIARHEGLGIPMINAKLKEKYPDLEIVNTAVSGINSGAFFARLSELVLKVEQCDKLIILLGTNDLASHKQVPLPQFKKNMELNASASVCLYWPQYDYLVSPPAVDENKQRVRRNNVVSKYSKVMKSVAEEYNFHFIDLYCEMIKHGDLKHLCCGMKNDGLHFGREGYELFAKLLEDGIKLDE